MTRALLPPNSPKDPVTERRIKNLEMRSLTRAAINQDEGEPAFDSRAATIVVAASDSSEASKAGADIVCSGSGDSADIQSALDFIAAVMGGKCQLCEGSFAIDSPIGVPSYVTLEGYGLDVTYLYEDGLSTTEPMVWSSSGGTDSPFNIAIRHLTLDADGDAQDCIRFKQGAYITLEYLHLLGPRRHGMAFLRSAFDHTDHTVKNCLIESVGQAGAGDGIYAEYANRGHYYDNTVLNATGGGALSFLNGQDAHAHHNIGRGLRGHGIALDGVASMMVDHNDLEGGPTGSVANSGIFLTNADAHVLEGNRVRTGAVNGWAYGINVSDAASSDTFATVNDLLSGGITAAFNDAGTTTVKINNRGDDI